MAQNHFIRPLTNRYHDFTQQRIQQTQQQVPYKFKSKVQQSYIKKPKIVYPAPPQPLPPPQPKKQFCQQNCGCCYNFYGRCSGLEFSSCCKSKPKVDHEQDQSVTCCNNKNKVGGCCCKSFQPQICQNCVNKLCEKCKKGMCLKFNMCGNCKSLMCAKCKQSLFCVPKPKIRNYQIPIKNKNRLHFADCTCPQCSKSSKKLSKVQQPQNKLTGSLQQAIFSNINQHKMPAESEVATYDNYNKNQHRQNNFLANSVQSHVNF